MAQTYQTANTNGSISITLTPTVDTTFYFKLLTIGTVSGFDSGYSDTKSVVVLTYTNCGNITVSVEAPIAEGSASLSWTVSTDGRNNPLSGYQVQYQDSADGFNWGAVGLLETVGANTYTAAINATRGAYRRYMITPIGTKAGFNGTTVTTGAVKTNIIPAQPIIIYPVNSKITHNNKPKVKV